MVFAMKEGQISYVQPNFGSLIPNTLSVAYFQSRAKFVFLPARFAYLFVNLRPSNERDFEEVTVGGHSRLRHRRVCACGQHDQ